jgi:hypothetical protein
MFANFVAVQYSGIDVATQQRRTGIFSGSAGNVHPCEIDKLNYAY